jgi:hypothetical protein
LVPRFAKDLAIVGRTFRIRQDIYEIVGVAPSGFKGTEPGTMPDVFAPVMMRGASVIGSFKLVLDWNVRTAKYRRFGQTAAIGAGRARLVQLVLVQSSMINPPDDPARLSRTRDAQYRETWRPKIGVGE